MTPRFRNLFITVFTSLQRGRDKLEPSLISSHLAASQGTPAPWLRITMLYTIEIWAGYHEANSPVQPGVCPQSTVTFLCCNSHFRARGFPLRQVYLTVSQLLIILVIFTLFLTNCYISDNSSLQFLRIPSKKASPRYSCVRKHSKRARLLNITSAW